jgi:hypothetical protein
MLALFVSEADFGLLGWLNVGVTGLRFLRHMQLFDSILILFFFVFIFGLHGTGMIGYKYSPIGEYHGVRG